MSELSLIFFVKTCSINNSLLSNGWSRGVTFVLIRQWLESLSFFFLNQLESKQKWFIFSWNTNQVGPEGLLPSADTLDYPFRRRWITPKLCC